MLEIIIPGDEGWDPVNEEFVPTVPSTKIKLEHSLLSLAKWEGRWHKPFLKASDRSVDEMLDYIRCMTITQNVAPEVYRRLSKANLEAINRYIDDPATATTFYSLRENQSKKKQVPKWMADRKFQTAETIYAAMFECGIPIEFEKRHLNHLLTLIRVCQERMSPPEKMSKGDIRAWQSAQNAARRAKLGTKG